MRNDSPTPERGEATLQIEEAHPGGRTLDTEALRALLTRAAAAEGVALHRLTVVLAGRERVLRLNREHLGHNYPTDVLAFPFAEEEGVVAGEVYVDLDTAAERHEEFGATPEQEARRYALHGLLHLAGYRDKTDAGRRQMRALEDRHLSAAASLDDDA
jgi:rRNA maturation RNase YbeY